MKIDKYIQDNFPSLKGKTYIVTGANSGIGYYASFHLAKLGAKVYLACRNEGRANNAIKKMHEDDASLDLHFLPYDQSDLKSIETFARCLKEIDFDGLVLNAAIYHPKEKKMMSVDGYPLIMMTNYLGAFHLLENLEVYLANKKQYKIVAVGSLEASNWKEGRLYRTLKEEYKSRTYRYNVSKMLLTKLMIYFGKRSLVNHRYMVAEPGISSTDITKNMPRFISFLGKYFLRLFFHSPEKASLTILKALFDDTNDNPAYFVPRGLFTFSGFPKKKKFKKKHTTNVEYAYIMTRKVLYDEEG